MRLIVLMFLALFAPEKKNVEIQLLGQLQPKKATGAEPEAYWIQVGTTRYALALDATGAKTAARLRGKFVTATGAMVDGSARLAGKKSLLRQEAQSISGYVRAAPGKGNEKALSIRLETKDATYPVPGAAARKFKKFVDRYVTVQGFVTSDEKFRQFETVKSVALTLAPGARNPRKGEEAMTGSWKGTLVAEKVPAGVPGANVGDKLAVSFAASDALKKVVGSLTSTYDVTGLKIRKFSAKKRTAKFDLDYTFGSGSYSVRFEAKFAEDWKSATGIWKSSFLGSGTFTMTWKK
jgi:hypothetical protein